MTVPKISIIVPVFNVEQAEFNLQMQQNSD